MSEPEDALPDEATLPHCWSYSGFAPRGLDAVPGHTYVCDEKGWAVIVTQRSPNKFRVYLRNIWDRRAMPGGGDQVEHRESSAQGAKAMALGFMYDPWQFTED